MNRTLGRSLPDWRQDVSAYICESLYIVIFLLNKNVEGLFRRFSKRRPRTDPIFVCFKLTVGRLASVQVQGWSVWICRLGRNVTLGQRDKQNRLCIRHFCGGGAHALRTRV